MEQQQLLINNKWTASANEETIDIYSPWENKVCGTIQAATVEQANAAVTAAQKAFADWRMTSIAERITIMRKAIELIRQDRDRIVAQLSLEIGKKQDSAASEFDRSLEYAELVIEALKHQKGAVYSGDVTGHYDRMRETGIYTREPLGVVLAISSFNYPLNLSITKIAPALLAGNTVVFKPAAQGSVSATLFYSKFVEAGFPPGVFNLVTGRSSVIGDTLLTHNDVKLIAFTGSTKVGNHIREVSKGIPLLLELGGKDVALVTANADLEMAASEIISGGFSYCGQRCTAQKLVLVYEEVADKLSELLKEKAASLELPPMIDSGAADYIMELLEDATSKGANHILQGERNENHIAPNLLDNVTPEMRVFSEEQFGPVLPITRVNGEDMAVNYQANIQYGLQASVYTQDIDEAFRIADKLEVGTVQINGRSDRGPDNFPFGGVKDSGQYMQGTLETLKLMTRGKLTVLNLHKV